MTQTEIAGQQYRMNKLSPLSQFHVSRRIAPVLPTLIPIFVKLTKDASVSKDLIGLAELLTPFMDYLAGLSDEDGEFILNSCLAVVQREHMGNWTLVWNTQSKVCMFEDMDLGVMVMLTLQVMQDSLSKFINTVFTAQMSGEKLSPTMIADSFLNSAIPTAI